MRARTAAINLIHRVNQFIITRNTLRLPYNFDIIRKEHNKYIARSQLGAKMADVMDEIIDDCMDEVIKAWSEYKNEQTRIT